jgi:hypothetical protein
MPSLQCPTTLPGTGGGYDMMHCIILLVVACKCIIGMEPRVYIGDEPLILNNDGDREMAATGLQVAPAEVSMGTGLDGDKIARWDKDGSKSATLTCYMDYSIGQHNFCRSKRSLIELTIM